MLKNVRHEAFCQAYALGGNASEAYRKAGYSAKDADVAGPRLLGNVGIQQRIEQIRLENDGKSELTKAQALHYLAQIIRTPIGEIDQNHHLAQEYAITEHGHRLKMPGKLEALKLLGQWCGWEKGTEAENKAADSLRDVMAEIRARR